LVISSVDRTDERPRPWTHATTLRPFGGPIVFVIDTVMSVRRQTATTIPDR
jgi:hypothetical protein